MASPPFPEEFTVPWRDLLRSKQASQINDFPNYHVFNSNSLVSSAIPCELYVGTGLSIFERALFPAILSAHRSVHFVTCYWADSPSLDAFRDTLLRLAARRKEERHSSTLKITIGFSSRGLFQKLFHTSSRDGHVYKPSDWGSLGLPDEQTLRDARIDMTVKSLFFTPFSVMHPKYLVVDEEKAWVPSCNVSWERWFEGCIAVDGDIVSKILNFHERVWGTGAWSTFGDGQRTPPRDDHYDPDRVSSPRNVGTHPGEKGAATQSLGFDRNEAVPAIFLPSPHHRNPRFSFFPFLSHTNPPTTPLNASLLTLFGLAKRQIIILTPNVTSWPALEALLDALARGVNVQIRTSKGMMFIEQLVTAGTWTSRCLGQFIKRYKALVTERGRNRGCDTEADRVRPGRLEIFYWHEKDDRKGQEDEPVVSHFKMTMVDDEYVVFGSGNMDRASWWTSQEIGVLLHVPGFEGSALWEEVLADRGELLFSSESLPGASPP